MNEHRRYRDMTDAELESLIAGLPGREPRPSLRERVLSPSPAPHRRRASALLPALALSAFIILSIADVLVAQRQQTSFAVVLSTSSAVALAQPAPPDEAALLRDLAASGIHLRVALRQTSPRPETYLEFRNRILNEIDGG